MIQPRTIGPTVVGISNMVVGMVGGIGTTMLLNDGANFPAAADKVATVGAEIAVATVGGTPLLLKGLLGLVAFGLMSFGGFALLPRKAWGRTMCIASTALLFCFVAWTTVDGPSHALTWAAMAFSIATTGVIIKSNWKREFGYQLFVAPDSDYTMTDQYRKAA